MLALKCLLCVIECNSNSNSSSSLLLLLFGLVSRLLEPCSSSNSSYLESIQGDTSIPITVVSYEIQNILAHINLTTSAVSQPFVGVIDSPSEKQGNMVGLERVKGKDPAARQERGDQVERRVLGGGSHEDNAAIFNDGQERVLLGFVKSVNLIHEQNGSLVALHSQLSGLVHGVPDIFDAAGDSG
ncbi:hypothetical protein S245_057809 [Arachis hypogaea]